MMRLLICAAAVFLFRCHGQEPKTLTLREAEQIALKNHPRIRAAEFRAQASAAVIEQTRAAFYPVLSGSLTATHAQELTRLSAGNLQDSSLSSRSAGGLSLLQMVSDFGRSSQLTASSRSHAQSLREEVAFSRTRVLLHVREVFLRALLAQSILRSARKNLETRQITARQITRLAESNLRSSLDASFADVNVSEAELVVVRAENDLAASLAQLSAGMGLNEPGNYIPQPAANPGPLELSPELLIRKGRENRPDLAVLRYRYEGAKRFAEAERRLKLPTVSALGVTGLVPFGERRLPSSYGAFGVNVSFPLFNGGLFQARHTEAALRSQEVSQEVRDLEIRVSAAVRVAWLNAQTAWRRLAVTQRLAEQAQRSLRLAQTRYELGLSSIIEISQAQLNQVNAEIAGSAAQYEYQIQLSVLDYETGSLR